MPIAMGEVRLDFDGDGQKTDMESLWQIYSKVMNLPIQPEAVTAFEIAFDRGDAYWLEGYTHILAAFSEFLLAYDRRDIFNAVGHVLFAKAQTPFASAVTFDIQSDQRFLDAIAALHTLSFPIAEGNRLETVHQHLTAMLSLSRRSWQAITTETDNDREWIPNPKQQGVIANVPVSSEMIDSWLGFIDEAETLFSGKKLIPFWRSQPQNANRGINLRRFFFEPQPFDPILWVQGSAAIPYLEAGTLTDNGVWDRLFRTFGNNAIGFAIWFN
ncbi:MAG: hypothetical protein HC919_07410 [Oscillatoriales cyanobacterium SM2_2_1]|nr:hypothetical protein [Oscillatoriales cyanobacterium SM2_2_1]